MRHNKDGVVYGFEDYTLIYAGDTLLTGKYFYLGKGYYKGTHILGKESLVSLDNSYGQDLLKEVYKDHKELLKEGMKLYIHPNCSISRSLVFAKYKKTLNPFMADAVVLPSQPEYVYTKKEALFINENRKFILDIPIPHYFADEMLMHLKADTPIRDIIKISQFSNYTNLFITEEDINDSLFMCYGKSLIIPDKENYLVEVLTGSLPLHNIVSEESLQESLGDDSNKLDYNSLTSIYDLLKSSDAASVGAGMKALSMMDYSGYPNSVRYVFKKAFPCFWGYNKAFSATSVKFMLNKLYDNKWNRRGRGMTTYSEKINKRDYELFKELYLRYDKENPTESQCYLDFMRCTPEGYVPILEETA